MEKINQIKTMKPCLNCGKPIDDENKEEMCKNCFNKWIEFDKLYPLL